MRIKVRAQYEPEEVAKLATRALGTTITGGHIRTLISECVDVSSITRYAIPGKLVVHMLDHMKACYRKPGRMNFGAYLDSIGFPRPAPDDVRRVEAPPAVVAKKTAETFGDPSASSIVEVQIAELRKEVAELREEMRPLKEAAVPLPPSRRLPGNGDGLRERFKTMVGRWRNDRKGSIGFKMAYADVYRGFWEIFSPQPVDWFSSQVKNETELQWFADSGLLGLLCEVTPGILVGMSTRYPLDPSGDRGRQGELPL